MDCIVVISVYLHSLSSIHSGSPVRSLLQMVKKVKPKAFYQSILFPLIEATIEFEHFMLISICPLPLAYSHINIRNSFCLCTSQSRCENESQFWYHAQSLILTILQTKTLTVSIRWGWDWNCGWDWKRKCKRINLTGKKSVCIIWNEFWLLWFGKRVDWLEKLQKLNLAIAKIQVIIFWYNFLLNSIVSVVIIWINFKENFQEKN